MRFEEAYEGWTGSKFGANQHYCPQDGHSRGTYLHQYHCGTIEIWIVSILSIHNMYCRPLFVLTAQTRACISTQKSTSLPAIFSSNDRFTSRSGLILIAGGDAADGCG